MALNPDDPAKAQAWLRGSGTQADPFKIDLYVPRGSKGDPGGLTNTIVPNGTDIDQYLTAGAYSVTAGVDAAASALQHLPMHESGTLLVTLSQVQNIQIQTFITNTKGIYVRRRFSGSWNSWRHFGTSRVDQTAGRAMYSWDEVNQREQLTWGDTGGRNIVSMVTNGWAASIATVRRVNSMVTLGLYLANPATKTDFHIFTLPLGFRPNAVGGDSRFPVQGTGNATTWALLKTNGDVIPDGTMTSFTSGMGVLTFPTNDPWPTTLPGTANGTIPNT